MNLNDCLHVRQRAAQHKSASGVHIYSKFTSEIFKICCKSKIEGCGCGKELCEAEGHKKACGWWYIVQGLIRMPESR